MSRGLSLSFIQASVSRCTSLDSKYDSILSKCAKYIVDRCNFYNAKYYNTMDSSIIFRVYEDGKRIRYLTFNFTNKLIIIKYGTKTLNKRIGVYLLI